MDRDNYVGAMGIVSDIRGVRLDGPKGYQRALLTSRMYRSMGLPNKAITTLREEAKLISDAKLRRSLSVELARCYMAADDHAATREILEEVLPKVDSVALAQEVSCMLAETCLKSGKVGQAIVVAEELLTSGASPDIALRARETLGAAYLAMKDYEKAALVFVGLLPSKPGAKKL